MIHSSEEEEFEHELDVFRIEVDSGTQFFYAYLAVNAALSANKAALDAVNKAPLFWGTNVGALQAAFFITLGRIFDQKSNHNVDKLLRLAQNNISIFSKEALAKRKRKLSENADEWLDDYLEDVYVPTSDDFRGLKKHIRKYRQIYEQKYRNIRHKIFTHKELSKPDDIQRLYSMTNIGELEKLCIFLNKLHQTLWELLSNGRKPILRPMRYSARNMRKRPQPEWYGQTVQERIVTETHTYFEMMTPKAQHYAAPDRR